MKWHEGDMFEAAAAYERNAIGFTANSTVRADKLVMGAGAALAVRDKYPQAAADFGKLLSGTASRTISETEAEMADYHWLRTKVSDEKTPWIYAIQVKRGLDQKPSTHKQSWWALTEESLKAIASHLDAEPEVKLVMNCPLIGHGGHASDEAKVKAMVERILGDRDVVVCTVKTT